MQWRIWVCRGRFEFAMANLNFSRWIWICCSKFFGEFDFAMVNLNLVLRIWIFRSEVEFGVANLILPRSIWICRGEFELSVLNLNLLQWIWICCGEFEFATVNVPRWILICCVEFKCAVVNLNLPWRIWIYCGEFEIAAVNLNLQLWFWICHGEFEIYCDPQVSRQNFKFFPQYFIVRSKIFNYLFNHCKTFFLTAKLSSSRHYNSSNNGQGKSRQIFLSRGKSFYHCKTFHAICVQLPRGTFWRGF